jgi:hypothetical protein
VVAVLLVEDAANGRLPVIDDDMRASTAQESLVRSTLSLCCLSFSLCVVAWVEMRMRTAAPKRSSCEQRETGQREKAFFFFSVKKKIATFFFVGVASRLLAAAGAGSCKECGCTRLLEFWRCTRTHKRMRDERRFF